MNMKDQNVLFLTRTMHLGGTENVVLQLCEILYPQVNKIIVCSCGGVNIGRLKEFGISHYTIPDITKKNIKTIFEVSIIIKKILKEEKITIIHSHHRMAAFYAQFLCKRSIIKVANVHNTFYDKKLFTRIAYQNTKLIAVGEQVKKNLKAIYGMADKQIVVIHNAVKPFNEHVKIDCDLQEEKKRGHILIGNIGRLSEQKGMEYFIYAASLVIKQCSNARFFIIGDGEEAGKLMVMAKEMLGEDKLFFMGYRSDIQNIMSQLDFVVLSSLWEGLPLTPIEAFSVGKTIIATAVDGTPEIVRHERNGLLIESRDVKGLASNIIRLCNDVELRKYLESNAIVTYNSEFSFAVLSDRYIKFYHEVLEAL